MNVTISKEYHICCAHRLDHMPEGHPCNSEHGHNYVIRARLTGRVDRETGFLMDYNDLDTIFGDTLKLDFDHKNLNVVLGTGLYTTAENLAFYFCGLLVEGLKLNRKEVFRRLTHVAVDVEETPKTRATVELLAR